LARPPQLDGDALQVEWDLYGFPLSFYKSNMLTPPRRR
jgi:hypothetical protein